MGLLQGIVLGAGVDPSNTLNVLREQGALGTIAGGNVLRLCPALTITRDELHDGLERVRNAFAKLAEKAP
jgi:acetylornithine/succinyldiaminopimelate/putrescine aminotransferase